MNNLSKSVSTPMNIDIRYNASGVDWQFVSDTLRLVGMAYHDLDAHRRAFEASHTTVFAWHEGALIGFGRAISDGVYQAAVYDVAVLPEFQGKGVGTLIMNHILERVSPCNVILYAAPGKETFYHTLHFRRLKTGMALFKKADAMTEKGITE